VFVAGASWHIGNVPHVKRLSKGVSGRVVKTTPFEAQGVPHHVVALGGLATSDIRQFTNTEGHHEGHEEHEGRI